MKIKLLCWPVLLAGVLIFWGCTKRKMPATDNHAVALYHCMEKTTGPYICFDSLLTDSRCPAGGVCIWQGTALVKISFHERQNTHKFTMSLKGFPDLSYPSDTTINGYKITFTDLKPYPGVDGNSHETTRTEAFFTISY